MEASPRQCHRSARSVRRSQILARAAFVGLGATPRKSQNQRLRAVTSPSSTTALTRCSGTNPSTVEPSWTLVRIPASARSKRAGAVAASVGGLFRLRIRQRQPVAAPRHHLSDTLFVLVWLSDNRRLAVFVLVFFILVFLVSSIIVIIGVSRRRRQIAETARARARYAGAGDQRSAARSDWFAWRLAAL